MVETKYIIFGLDEEMYSMDLKYVKELEEKYVIVPIPNCPPDIKGIINLRGDVIPVYSLRSRFGKPALREPGKLILAYIHGSVIAFEVDRVCGIENIAAGDVLETPRLIMNEETTYIDSVIHASMGIVVNISVEHILSESQVTAISDSLEENA